MNDRIGRAWSLVAAALLIVCVFTWLGFEIRKGRLTNTDELVTAERSREMLLTHEWTVQFNFQPSFEKPPLQYWLTTLTLPHIGQREAAVRIWPLIFGGAFWPADECACLGLKWKSQRCRQEDTASHNCNRHRIVGRDSKHKASHGPDPRQGLVAAWKRGKPLKVLWLPAFGYPIRNAERKFIF